MGFTSGFTPTRFPLTFRRLFFGLITSNNAGSSAVLPVSTVPLLDTGQVCPVSLAPTLAVPAWSQAADGP